MSVSVSVGVVPWLVPTVCSLTLSQRRVQTTSTIMVRAWPGLHLGCNALAHGNIKPGEQVVVVVKVFNRHAHHTSMQSCVCAQPRERERERESSTPLESNQIAQLCGISAFLRLREGGKETRFVSSRCVCGWVCLVSGCICSAAGLACMAASPC